MKVVLVAVLLLAALPVWSQADSDTQAIQAVITGQWQAFQDGDGEKALSYAIPPFRESFPLPERFLQMVENGYPMVYHHKGTRFLEPKIIDNISFQVVRVTDQDADVWMVLYQLQKQDDGRWLIGGVSAFPAATVPDLVLPPEGS